MSINKVKICLVQLKGRSTPIENAKILGKLFKQSLRNKPNIIFTPECSNIITGNNKHLLNNTTSINDCPVLKMAKEFAKNNNVFISLGSLLLKKNYSKKLLNRSFFINNNGNVVKIYDKINLFDVNISKKEKYCESKTFIKGKKISLVNTLWGKFGLTICYDLRFPHLYRKLAKSNSNFLLIPSAFTEITGKSHFKTLLKARAIENSCFIIAAAQCGKHHGSRKTYGHSMVIDPWGKILLEAKKKEGLFFKELDINQVKIIRSKIPSIKN